MLLEMMYECVLMNGMPECVCDAVQASIRESGVSGHSMGVPTSTLVVGNTIYTRFWRDAIPSYSQLCVYVTQNVMI